VAAYDSAVRRFELSEGTSHKFWQIALDGSAFTVTWGRIGTNGQTQTKTFESAGKAQKEHDKLVDEKVKKGYAEVNGASAGPPAPSATKKPVTAASLPALSPAVSTQASNAGAAPKPAPIEPAPRVVQAPSVVWTPALSRAASPVRGGFERPVSGNDPAELRAAIVKGAAAYLADLEADLGRPGAASAAMQAARAFFANPDAPLDLEGQAAVFVLFGPTRSWMETDCCETIVRFWIALAGLDFALRALGAAGGLTRVTETKPGGLRIWLEPKPSPELASARNWTHAMWRPLREHVAVLDEAAFAKAIATAADIRSGAPLWVRSVLAAAFADTEWALSDADEWLATPRQTAWGLWPLVVSVAEPGDAMRLMAGAQSTHAHDWMVAHGMADVRADLLARFGVRAVAPLEELVRRTAAGGLGADQTRDTAQVLATIRSPEAAAAFVRMLENKDLRGVASTYLQSNPALAIPALAEAAAGKGGTADLARSLLAPLVASEPQLAGEAEASLSSAAREVVCQARDRGARVEEADPAELPPVLREPPWTRPRPRATSREVGVDPLEIDERLDWAAGQRQLWDTTASWARQTPEAEAQALGQIAKSRAIQTAAPWQNASCILILQLSEKNALAVMETDRFEGFSWYYPIARVLLARYELRALRGLLRYAAFDPIGALEAFEPVASVRVAPLMADALVRLKKGRPLAKAWLARFPEHAAAGLIPAAVGAPGKVRDAAGAALRYIASRGHEGVVRDVAARYGGECPAAVEDVLAYDPLFDLPAKLPKLPAFWQPAGLPRPRLATGKGLPLAAMDAMGTMLAFSRADEPYAGVVQVREACQAPSLAAFGWELFQAWMLAGAPSKESWAFSALGALGDDECARKLTALVRQWPGEGGHARAVTGLEVLARIGTDVALMHLHGIAQKVPFKGLQTKAREKIDEIAEARGLTAEELGDRLVPDLGLDDDGSLTLDFGPRAFRVGFDESLKPYVLDATGKRVVDLPKPGKSDDAEKAKAAVETWKALKKDVRTIASSQILRLELAMCAQRRWTVDVFQRFLVGHPLLVHLVRRVVWGTFEEGGRLASAFRVAEDRTLADENDAAYTPPAGALVGIPHALEFGEEPTARWGQVLGDYEIIQPFPQLSRETFTPTAEQQQAISLPTVKGLKVPTGKVLGLDARGWRRGAPQDAGVVCWYEKPLGDGAAIHLDLSGIYTGSIADSPEQELGDVVVQQEGTWGAESRRAFGALPPVVFSELLRDLNSLRT
jgi:predicted DNA-binding WGR domain protein